MVIDRGYGMPISHYERADMKPYLVMKQVLDRPESAGALKQEPAGSPARKTFDVEAAHRHYRSSCSKVVNS